MALRDVLLRITGDGSDAKRAVAEVKSTVKSFDGTKATGVLEVDGVTAAKARVAELRGDLAKFDGTTATAKLKLDHAAATADLDKLEARLNRGLDIKDPGRRSNVLTGLLGPLSNGLDRVERKSNSVTAGLAKVGLASAEAGAKGAGAAAQVVGAVSAVGGALASTLSVVGATLSATVSAIPIVGGPISALVSGILSIGPAALIAIPVIGVLAFTIGGLLVQALIGAAAALTALLAVVAGAVAGLAALGVAALAVAAPIAILAVGALAKLAKALLGSKDASAKAQTATENLAGAQRTQAQAASSLADAQRNVSQQRIAALQAERAAVEGVRDAELSREAAINGKANARLNLRQARLDLKEARGSAGGRAASATTAPLFQKLTDVATDPSAIDPALRGLKVSGAKGGQSEAQAQLDLAKKIQAVRDAKLSVAQADNSAVDASNALSTALQTQAKFAREGARAYKPYTDALKQVATAERALATAEDKTAKARRVNVKAAENLAGATTGIGGTLSAFGKTLGATIGPAVDAIFKGAGAGLAAIAAVLPSLQGGFTQLGTAIGGGLEVLGKLFSSPLFVEAFSQFTATAADLVTHFATPVVGHFATLLLSVATVALPLLRSGLVSLGEKFGVFTEGATKGNRIKRIVDSLYSSFKSVVNFAGAVTGAIIAIFAGGQKPGRRILDTVTAIINKFTSGLGTKKGQADLKRFFDNGVKFARAFKSAVGDLITILNVMVSVARKAVDLFNAAKQIKEGKSGDAVAAQDRNKASLENAQNIAAKATDPEKTSLERLGQLPALRLALKALGETVGAPKGWSPRRIADEFGIKVPPGLKDGGVTKGRMFAEIGEQPGVQEAVIPLRQDVLAGIGNAIARAITVPLPRTPALTGPVPFAGGFGGNTVKQTNHYNEAPGNLAHDQQVSMRQLGDLVKGLV